MTILVDRAPLPTRKAESAGRIWLPGIAGVAAALSLAALLWLILLRIGTATKLGALLAVDTAEQLAFDTGQVQPFVAETSGVQDAALASVAAANATLAQGTTEAQSAAQQADTLDATADAAVASSATFLALANTTLALGQTPFATLTGRSLTFVSSANLGLTVWVVPFALLKIGKTVTGFFSGGFFGSPFEAPVTYSPGTTLVSTEFTTGVGGVQASDQDPSGPAIQWLPPSDHNIVAMLIGGLFAPSLVIEVGTTTIHAGNFCTVTPPVGTFPEILRSFTTSWKTLT